MAEDRGTMRTIRKAAEEQGWRIERTGSDHLRWIPPDARHSPVITSTTSSDWRAARNTLSRLRQRGLRMDRREEKAMEVALKEEGVAAVGAEVVVAVPQVAAVLEDEQFWCEDCGCTHPKEEMALSRKGVPTRFCNTHLRARLSRGRQAQIARNRIPAAPQGGGENHSAADDEVYETQKEDEVNKTTVEESVSGLVEARIKELMRGEVEVLLVALDDVKTGLEERLTTIEHGRSNGHADPGAGGALLAVGEERTQSLVRFGLQALFLGGFDDADLPPDQKAALIIKAASKLAARLG